MAVLALWGNSRVSVSVTFVTCKRGQVRYGDCMSEHYGGQEADPVQIILWRVRRVEEAVYGDARNRHGGEKITFGYRNKLDGTTHMRTLSYTVSFEGGHSVYMPLLTDTTIAADGTVTEESYDLRLDGGVGYYAPGSQVPETGNPVRMAEMADRLYDLEDNITRHPNYCAADGIPLRRLHASS